MVTQTPIRTLILILALLVAAPASAQSHARANVASNVTVYSAIGFDTLHSLRADDRSVALACQGIRLGVTIGVAEILKRTISKDRPDHSDRKSFPSMHTGVAMASAGWRWSIGVPLAVSTGGLRIAAKKHDYVDVLAGAGIGYLSRVVGPCDQP